MCGVTGAVIYEPSNTYWRLLEASEIRGQDGTGVTHLSMDGIFTTLKSSKKASRCSFKNLVYFEPGDMIIGQNRLAIFGLTPNNNQPIATREYSLVHNGNLFDFEPIFDRLNLIRKYKVDSELLLRLIQKGYSINEIDSIVKGNYACIYIDKLSPLMFAFCRDKPIYKYKDSSGLYLFSTERIGEKVFGRKLFDKLEDNKLYAYDRLKAFGL